MEASAAAGGAGTKVHGLATGCGQRVNGLRCPLPCPAFVSARPRHAHSSAHTAEVDLTEVGSKTLWAFALRPQRLLRVGLQAGGPMGLP